MGVGASVRAGFAAVRPPALFPLFSALLVFLVFAAPLNHDEDQYLAASVLAAHATLFRDFLYVQTPLQPWLTAPLASLATGHAFLALRLVSAAMGVAALAGVWTAQRRLAVGRGTANLATVLMAACYVFQFCSSAFRNDALPTALLAWGVAAAVWALRDEATVRWPGWLLCGLSLAAATSAKASFALLLAAAGLFVGINLARRRDIPAFREAAGFGVGAAAGLSPIAWAWASDPVVVRYALLDYWGEAPRRWYVANGLQERLEAPSKLLHALGDLALGPALPALAVVAWSAIALRREASPATRLLDLLIVAALIAALLPSPTYKQYFAPLLPPLFVRLGLALRDGAKAPWIAPALAVGALAGVGTFGWLAAPALRSGPWTPLQVARENAWIGDALRRAHARGAIATLSPHAVLDCGFPLDPRFAGGAMIYRSADGIDPALRARLHVTAPSSLAADLDAAPPAAIVTGYEDGGGDVRVRLDEGLRAYARTRGYAMSRSPWGAAELYIRPVGSRR